MGMITITINGSFSPRKTWQCCAVNSGHADTVAQAIEFLAKEVLPAAIRQDHELALQGIKPDVGFGVRKKEEINHAQ